VKSENVKCRQEIMAEYTRSSENDRGKELDNNMIIRWHRSYLIELISSLSALLKREGCCGLVNYLK